MNVDSPHSLLIVNALCKSGLHNGRQTGSNEKEDEEEIAREGQAEVTATPARVLL